MPLTFKHIIITTKLPKISIWENTFEFLLFQNMVVRYGAINDDDNASEGIEDSAIPVSRYKTMLAGRI